MVYTDILYDSTDGIATIAINRADRLNCFRGRTIEELIHAFKRAWAEKGVGAVILTAAGSKAHHTRRVHPHQHRRHHERHPDGGRPPPLQRLAEAAAAQRKDMKL